MLKRISFFLSVCVIFSITINLFSEETAIENAYINGDYVNLRKSPDKKAESYGYLMIGTSVKILKKSDKSETINNKNEYWYLCQTDVGEGWVFGSFIIKGKFNLENYLKNIPKLSNIPQEYNELINNYWTNCTQKESNEGGMGCYPIKFTENIIINQFPPADTYYQIIDIKTEKKSLLLKIKLILSQGYITDNYQDFHLNISGIKDFYTIKISQDPSKQSVIINGKPIYSNKVKN